MSFETEPSYERGSEVDFGHFLSVLRRCYNSKDFPPDRSQLFPDAQGVYSRLAGSRAVETLATTGSSSGEQVNVNDAERLRVDPVMRRVVVGRAQEKQAASTSEMSRFETEMLSSKPGSSVS